MNGQRLRPLGLGDVFDEGFDLYKRSFVFLLLVTAVAVVPLDIFRAFAEPRLLAWVFDLFGITAARTDAFWVWLATDVTRMLVFFPLLAAAVAPLAAACAGRYLEQPQTLWQVYRAWLRRLPALLLTVVVSSLALDLSVAFCLLPSLFVAPRLVFILQAFLVEGLRPDRALGRAAALARGDGGRVLGCVALLWLIAWVIGLGVSSPLAYLVDTALNIAPGAGGFAGAGGGGPTAEQQVVALLSGGLAHLVLLPFVVCVTTVLYFDLRIRKEGYDIERLAQGLHYPPLAALGPHLPPVPAFVPARPLVRPAPLPKREGPR